jgi:hypothetical protein
MITGNLTIDVLLWVFVVIPISLLVAATFLK